jgi:Nucleotidyltransferase domain
MESDDGFRSFSHAIESDPIGVLLAKWRRDAFIAKLKRLPDVAEVIPSGSLAHGTHIGPVHDVDLIVVFKSSEQPDYGSGRDSAQAAMEHLQDGLREQLHPWRGAEPALLDDTELRRHVVNCHGGWTGPFAEIIPSAPPVDVMPAVRKGAHLRIPERGTGWIDVDPEKFMRQVEQRQREWKYFTEVVGMVKAWAEQNNLGMKSIAIEVMVLKYCPRPGMFETLSCGEAVARFFEAAAKANITSLKDPAGRCGEIDPGMNYTKLQKALARAAGLARQAMDAEHAWENPRQATGVVPHPDEFWRKVFGKKYPRARKRFLRAPSTEPWFGKYTAEPPRAASPRNPRPETPSDGPKRPDPRSPEGPGGRGPEGPDRGPDGPNLKPHGPGPGHPPGGIPGRPGGRDGKAWGRPRPADPSDRPEPAPAETGTSVWTEIFGSAAVTVSVPLTFG